MRDDEFCRKIVDGLVSLSSHLGLCLEFIAAFHHYLTTSERGSTIYFLTSKSRTETLRWSISLRIKWEAQQSSDLKLYPHTHHTLGCRLIKVPLPVNVGFWVCSQTDGCRQTDRRIIGQTLWFCLVLLINFEQLLRSWKYHHLVKMWQSEEPRSNFKNEWLMQEST